jgi:hemoglobin
MARPSVYESVGGDAAFLRLAVAHHANCLADPVLNHPFSHPGHPQHLERLAGYWAEVLGGPPRFTEECGGQPAMLYLHSGTGADDDLGTRFVACFVAAVDEVGLGDDPELREVLRSYMEWAVNDVHAYSPKGSTVPADAVVPRWSWEGLQVPDD